jgi:hypothetical protein
LDGDSDHIALLVLAWNYILLARWAEIIPGASDPKYTKFKAQWDDRNIISENNSATPTTINIELGDISEAARWWAAVLALEGGWDATILSGRDNVLHSLWYTKIESEQCFTLSRSTKSCFLTAQHYAASLATALRYFSEYCKFYQVANQSYAALAATLLLPVARFDYRKI